jgi:hypothetical protein
MPLLRSYSRPVAWLMLGILAWHFWSPREWVRSFISPASRSRSRCAAWRRLCLIEVYGFGSSRSPYDHYGLHARHGGYTLVLAKVFWQTLGL